MNERDLLRALRAAVADGRVSVDLDCRRLRHTDSPIAVEADHNRWLYGVLALGVAVGFGLGWKWGVAALVPGVAAYWTVGRPWIHRRMRARFLDTTLDMLVDFKKLWHLHGVTLRLEADGTACASPDGDWRRFVLDRLMTPAAGAEPVSGG